VILGDENKTHGLIHRWIGSTKELIYCHTSVELVESELEPREAFSNAAVAVAIDGYKSDIRKKGLIRDEEGMICGSEEKEGEEDKTLFRISGAPVSGRRVLGRVGVKVTVVTSDKTDNHMSVIAIVSKMHCIE
jgi:hypothetical protein